MLLCRHILRAHTPHSASTRRLVQGHVRDRTSSNLRYSHANLVTRESFPKVIVQPSVPKPNDPPPDPRPVLLERVLRVSRYSVPKTAKQAAKQIMSENTKHDPFDAYTELRAQDPTLSASLPTDVLCRLAEGAVKYGSQEIVDSLTADVLDDYLLREHQRAEVAVSLLCVPRRYSSLLDKQTTLSLLAIIRRQEHPVALPVPATLHVMKTIVDDTTLDTLDQSLVNFILDPLLNHLASLQPPTGVKAVSYRPFEATSLAFALIDKFVSWKRYDEAFKLFQTLSDGDLIPPEAISAEVPPPLAHDFAVIVRSTLARACLHWDWHYRGVEFIASIMKSQDSLKRDLEPLALELLHTSLEKCSSVQFKACAWLMGRLVDPRCGVIIPNKTVRLFYSRAMRVGDRESAHVFYSFTQSRRVKRTINYPSPQGATLTWLMAYLVEQKHDVHLARSLAKQTVETSGPIPRYDRGRFIALAASQGFATEARALWERYSVGAGHEFVVGNAATMLRMVSLFAQRDLWTRTRLESKVEEPGVDEGCLKSGTEYQRFARRVLGAFRESVLPLEEADHFELSALARGYFMLGEMKKGLGAFRVLIKRQEIPDLHDVNIALSGMARQSPMAAWQTVERMAKQGLQPDGVTFGTVLHEAIVHGEVELVMEIVDGARKAGVALTGKTMVSLIRAGVAVEDEEGLGSNVEQAWKIVHKREEWSAVHRPNVGKCCIAACLRLEDPEMAFKFWDQLVRRKTEWRDLEQRRQRRAIGDAVLRQMREGRLDVVRARRMLLALDYNHQSIN